MDLASVVVVLVVIVIAVVLAAVGYRSSLEKQRQQQALLAKQMEGAQSAIERMESVVGDLSKLPDLREQLGGFILHPGERCFAMCRGAQHVVEAHRTKYVGASQGVSLRITKGVRYHIGGFSGRPVTMYYEKVQDTGDLCVTTERVVFTGNREVTSIAGKKIADVRMDGDHLWVLAENRKTPLGVKLTVPLAPVMAYAIRLLAESCQAPKHSVN
jgi:type II secretory pathway pseudopilin PulG